MAKKKSKSAPEQKPRFVIPPIVGNIFDWFDDPEPEPAAESEQKEKEHVSTSI